MNVRFHSTGKGSPWFLSCKDDPSSSPVSPTNYLRLGLGVGLGVGLFVGFSARLGEGLGVGLGVGF